MIMDEQYRVTMVTLALPLPTRSARLTCSPYCRDKGHNTWDIILNMMQLNDVELHTAPQRTAVDSYGMAACAAAGST